MKNYVKPQLEIHMFSVNTVVMDATASPSPMPVPIPADALNSAVGQIVPDVQTSTRYYADLGSADGEDWDWQNRE